MANTYVWVNIKVYHFEHKVFEMSTSMFFIGAMTMKKKINRFRKSKLGKVKKVGKESSEEPETIDHYESEWNIKYLTINYYNCLYNYVLYVNI